LGAYAYIIIGKVDVKEISEMRNEGIDDIKRQIKNNVFPWNILIDFGTSFICDSPIDIKN